MAAVSVVPLAVTAVLSEVGGWIGPGPTLAVLVLTAALAGMPQPRGSWSQP